MHSTDSTALNLASWLASRSDWNFGTTCQTECPNSEHHDELNYRTKCREQRHTGGDVQTGREELQEREAHEGEAPKKTREVNKWTWPRNNESEEQRDHSQTVNSKDSISKRKRSITNQKQPKEGLMKIQETSRTKNEWTNQWPTTETLSMSWWRLKGCRSDKQSNPTSNQKRLNQNHQRQDLWKSTNLRPKAQRSTSWGTWQCPHNQQRFTGTTLKKKHGKKYSRRLFN